MAMVTCPQCSKRHPASAATCPHCGYQAAAGAPTPNETVRMNVSDLFNAAPVVSEQIDENALGEMELPRRHSLFFEVLTGPHKGRVLEVTENPFTLGREFWDVGAQDAQVSRVHATVQVYGERAIVVRDISSTNGTFVNGRLVTEARLLDGDTLRVGAVDLKLKVRKKG